MGSLRNKNARTTAEVSYYSENDCHVLILSKNRPDSDFFINNHNLFSMYYSAIIRVSFFEARL